MSILSVVMSNLVCQSYAEFCWKARNCLDPLRPFAVPVRNMATTSTTQSTGSFSVSKYCVQVEHILVVSLKCQVDTISAIDMAFKSSGRVREMM